MLGLIIGDAERAAIAKLRALAQANPQDVHQIDIASSKNIAAFREVMKTMSIWLPVGYAVTYTHEIQPNAPPPGVCHHISISVDRPNKLPAPEAVDVILEQFGMKTLKESEGVWIEDIAPGEKAVNVIQLIAHGEEGG